jgi:DNA-binding transcriptional MerR regulator
MLHQLDLFGGEPVKIDGKGPSAGKRNNKSKQEKNITPTPEAQQIPEPTEAKVQAPLPDLFTGLIEEPTVQLESPVTILPVSDADSGEGNTTIQTKTIPAQEPDKDAENGDPEVPADEILFSKQYYPISEVAKMFKANVSLLRYWEKEFDIIKPRKNRKGDRLFRPEDIKNLKLIHFLLKEKKYTIKGAKTFLKKGKLVKEKFEAVTVLKNIRAMLVELKSGLK